MMLLIDFSGVKGLKGGLNLYMDSTLNGVLYCKILASTTKNTL